MITGARIREARLLLGLEASALAKRAKLPSSVISRAESINGEPTIYGTSNGGRAWKRLDQGLPKTQAWWTVKRQAFAADRGAPVGLYFGTTSGELWASRSEGKSWACIARHLPEIYAVETADIG